MNVQQFVKKLAAKADDPVPELLTSADLDSNVDNAVQHGFEVGYSQALKDLAQLAKQALEGK